MIMMMMESMGDDSVFHADEAPPSTPRVHAHPQRLSPEDAARPRPASAICSPSPGRKSVGFAACRICHSGEASAPFAAEGEALISPCRCAGTMGLYHRSCLERWLSTSQTQACEICSFQYDVAREPEPFLAVLKRDEVEVKRERRNLCGDGVCCLILSPLALAVAFLCYKGGRYYMDKDEYSFQSPGLFAVAAALVATWAVWVLVCVSYHVRVARRWRSRWLRVKLLSTPDRAVTPRVFRPAPLDVIPEVTTETDSESPLVSSSNRSPTSATFSPKATSSPNANAPKKALGKTPMPHSPLNRYQGTTQL